MGLWDNNSSTYSEAKTTSVSSKKNVISNFSTNGFVGLSGNLALTRSTTKTESHCGIFCLQKRNLTTVHIAHVPIITIRAMQCTEFKPPKRTSYKLPIYILQSRAIIRQYVFSTAGGVPQIQTWPRIWRNTNIQIYNRLYMNRNVSDNMC